MLLKFVFASGLALWSTVQSVQTFANKGTYPGNWDGEYIDLGTQGMRIFTAQADSIKM